MKFRPVNPNISNVFWEFKFHWLHGASIILWLVCEWLRREEREQRVGLMCRLLLVGCCRLQGGHRSSNVVKCSVNEFFDRKKHVKASAIAVCPYFGAIERFLLITFTECAIPSPPYPSIHITIPLLFESSVP